MITSGLHTQNRIALHQTQALRFGKSGNDSPRYLEAKAFAADLHKSQVRKSNSPNSAPIPYFTHLDAVAELVRKYGADEDTRIAALLHDSIEDQAKNFPGGAQGLRDTILQKYGEKVLAIVNGCSDTDVFPKPSWDTRKRDYINEVEHIYDVFKQQYPPQFPGDRRYMDYADGTLMVSAADKIHNAQSTIDNVRDIGGEAYRVFKGGNLGTQFDLIGKAVATIRNYNSILTAYKSHTPFGQSAIVREYERVVQELVRVSEEKMPELKQYDLSSIFLSNTSLDKRPGA